MVAGLPALADAGAPGPPVVIISGLAVSNPEGQSIVNCKKTVANKLVVLQGHLGMAANLTEDALAARVQAAKTQFVSLLNRDS
jgi:hypothetical protein